MSILWNIAESLWILGVVLEIPWMFRDYDRYAKIVACCTFLPSIVLAATTAIVDIWMV